MNPNQDLASILRTLASANQSQWQAQPGPPAQQYPAIPPPDIHVPPPEPLEEGEYEPNEPNSYPPYSQPHQPQLQQFLDHPISESNPYDKSPAHERTEPPKPQIKQQQRINHPAPSAPQVDPSKIIAWAPALRYVTRKLQAQIDISNHISSLIRNQHKHERQWWEGRLELIKTQQGRSESRQKMEDILRAIGGKFGAGQSENETIDEEAELASYDLKTHNACLAMCKAVEKDLRNMHIPFFCIDSELVRQDPELPSPEKLDETQLAELKKKMLQLLEDLCSDDG